MRKNYEYFFLPKLMIHVLVCIVFLPIANYSQQSNYKDQVNECISQYDGNKYSNRNKESANCFIGQALPSLRLVDTGNKIYLTDSLKGKVLILNFWFTKCPPCLSEIPGINQLTKKYPSEKVLIFGLCNESKEVVSNFLNNRKMDYDAILIPDSYSLFRDELLGNTGFPTTFVIDQEGIIVDYFSGGPVGSIASEIIVDKLSRVIDRLLN
ncbi:MAG: TlpA family protein disulfide reductase [Saprospiraceae bacterium]|nr:TlpA family protein disulfide reductase [Saprospiraceae bacterium]HPK09213.1 TlpA disulfide reductase family protein [Saprospiraceae bacterium]